jgi:predicted aldo/keto reductase-like oxidoreductase
MKRRSFLKRAGALAGACTIGIRSATAQEARGTRRGRRQTGPLPRRTLGRTEEKLSIVGFPGLALRHYEQPECNAGIARAFERGLNYYDVAPAYGKDGECEIKMGIGLQQIPRDKIFLACKTKRREKDAAREELERSLKRLKTDHFDLYQMHCFFHPDEVEKAFGPNGAMETILKAKEEGKLRYIGFSAHTTKSAIAAMKTFKFDSVMFPINFVEYYNFGFGKEVCELAAEQGAGVLGIKTTSGGAWARGAERHRQWWYRTLEERNEIRMALRFTLSQPQVVAGITPSFLDLLDRTIDVAQRDRPITEEELTKLEEMAKTRGSVFLQQQQRAAQGEKPHDCCYHAYV